MKVGDLVEVKQSGCRLHITKFLKYDIVQLGYISPSDAVLNSFSKNFICLDDSVTAISVHHLKLVMTYEDWVTILKAEQEFPDVPAKGNTEVNKIKESDTITGLPVYMIGGIKDTYYKESDVRKLFDSDEEMKSTLFYVPVVSFGEGGYYTTHSIIQLIHDGWLKALKF